ncbi:hypothetical protein ABIB83_004680 [Bradyrhizobium sp. I1.8.5]
MPPAPYDIAVATFVSGTTEFAVLRDAALLATPYTSVAMAAILLLIASRVLHQQPAIGNVTAGHFAPS